MSVSGLQLAFCDIREAHMGHVLASNVRQRKQICLENKSNSEGISSEGARENSPTNLE